jgi:hypothetical protein
MRRFSADCFSRDGHVPVAYATLVSELPGTVLQFWDSNTSKFGLLDLKRGNHCVASSKGELRKEIPSLCLEPFIIRIRVGNQLRLLDKPDEMIMILSAALREKLDLKKTGGGKFRAMVFLASNQT